jgi:hypothetical protein
LPARRIEISAGGLPASTGACVGATGVSTGTSMVGSSRVSSYASNMAISPSSARKVAESASLFRIRVSLCATSGVRHHDDLGHGDLHEGT